MKKTNILMVSIVALMAAGAARADIASTTYVTSQLQPVETHMADEVAHITAAERTAWNAKENASNKATSTATGNDLSSDTKFPTTKLVGVMIDDALEDVATDAANAVSGLENKQDKNTAVTHTASTAVGSSTQPVYIASDGKATATNALGSWAWRSDTVKTADIEDLNVTTGKLAASAVTTAKIADENVTKGKLASDVQTSLTAADNALPASTYNTQVGTVNATNMGTAASTIVTAIKELSDNKQNKQIAAAGDAGKAVVVGSDGKMTISSNTLGSAAYTSSDAYDAAGAATAAEGRVNATIGTLPTGQSTVVGYIGSVAGTAGTAVQTVKVNNDALTETDGAVNITIAEGATNGTIAVNGTDVDVHGLGSAAYTNSNAYATSAQGTTADTTAAAVNNATTGLANTYSIATAAIPKPGTQCSNATDKCVLTYNNETYAWEVIGR